MDVTARDAEGARVDRRSDGSFVGAVLRTPLLTKLILLDLSINVLALVAMNMAPADLAQELTLVSLAIVLVLNAALVAWALKPLQALEITARRVSQGEFHARTVMPKMADRNLVRIGDTLDDLLDRVDAERARVRSLAVQVVAAGDQERSRIARELHDGTAQSLSALDMLLASTLAEHPDGPTTERMQMMRDIVTEALSEVRDLAHTVHPRVLDDLGLAAALEYLARRTRMGTELTIDVHADVADNPSHAVSSVLYRVAQEASHNAVKHGNAQHVSMSLVVEGGDAILVVEDDGKGFDLGAVRGARRGMGLFVMEERVSLVDGVFEVTSSPGAGTRVEARIPLREVA